MPGFFDGGFGIWFLLAFAVNIVIWGGLIVLVILGIRWLLRNGAGGRSRGLGGGVDDGALAVLRERFARGEIDATEFEERKRTLGG